MKNKLLMSLFLLLLNLTGCSTISIVATSSRMEEARTANAGKQLVPKDGGTYLIPIGTESVSYMGSGNTEWKINNSSFTQLKGTYTIVKVTPGIYNIYGNKRVIGGGEAGLAIEVKEGEAVCVFVFNPVSGSARIESYKGDSCDPMLRALKNKNIIGKVD